MVRNHAGTCAILLLGKRRKIVVVLIIPGIVLLVVGIVVSLTALLIDLTGFHTSPGFGSTQIAGVAAGVAAIFGGLVVLATRKKLPTQ